MARLRLPIGYIVIGCAFWVNARNCSPGTGHGHPFWANFQWWALILVALGSFLRMWSAGTLVKTTELSTDGPYALSRNPLYVGTFTGGLGLTLFVHSLALFAFFVITFVLAYSGQILWEEKLLFREHGEAFKRYCTQVSRFIPTRWSRDALGGAFAFPRLVANKELRYQVFWLVMIAGLICQAYLVSQGFGVSL